MAFTVSKAFEFDSAHRLMGYVGKCGNLHGHRYRVGVSLTFKGLDPLGMAVDVIHLKSTLGAWLDDNWDHRVLLNSEDPLGNFLLQEAENSEHDYPFFFHGNPTAEVMVEFLLDHKKLIFKDLLGNATSITFSVYETPTSCAVGSHELSDK